MKVHAKVDVYVKLSGTAIIIQIITVSGKKLFEAVFFRKSIRPRKSRYGKATKNLNIKESKIMKRKVLVSTAATLTAAVMMAGSAMAQDYKVGIIQFVDDASLNQIE